MQTLVENTPATTESFLQLNRTLLRNERYAHFSPTDILLYTIYLDRLRLSISNGANWQDDDGRFFFVYSNADAAQEIHVSEKSISRSRKTLIEAGLLEVRQVKRECYLLYLNKPESLDQFREDNSTRHDRTDCPANNNKQINNEYSINTNSTNSDQQKQQSTPTYTQQHSDYDMQQVQEDATQSSFARFGLDNRVFYNAMKLSNGNIKLVEQIKKMIFSEKKILNDIFWKFNDHVLYQSYGEQAATETFQLEKNPFLNIELINTLNYLVMAVSQDQKKNNPGYFRVTLSLALARGIKKYFEEVLYLNVADELIDFNVLNWKNRKQALNFKPQTQAQMQKMDNSRFIPNFKY